MIGYFPKVLTPPPSWMRELGIGEVASVSQCLAPGPDGWVQAWKHNSWGLFDDPELAWSVVPDHRRAEFHVYGYRLYPSEFANGAAKLLDGPAVRASPAGPSFESIGYDVVSRSTGTFFECSPLSCNLLAREMETNAYCLFPRLHQAVTLALEAEERRCEPGPYFVIEVWR